ncbi:hypothetical protein RND81_10G154200 [Saponaria officinalis]|uniref:DUF3615 domain-containing protein n=1 Tax=Saponaria officinalis TaxID=3572 RepID=A0AAW1I2E1_SAPOF
MLANGEPRVYFLRSRTVCHGKDLKFVCTRITDQRQPSPEVIPSADPRAPPRIRYRLEDFGPQNEKIANIGLSLLNLGARQYQLVKARMSSAFMTSRNFLYHGNFEAKPVADHEAPVELFFVELALGGGSLEKPIEDYILKSLGPCDSLPDLGEGVTFDDSGAHVTTKCRMCKFINIHHPKHVKLHMMPKK